ncbi:MAG: L-seryl-tRNA(Sec) selenium transferase [Chloroflexota bacterium]
MFAYRDLPSVDRVLAHERVKELSLSYPHDLLVGFVRDQLDAARKGIASGRPPPSVEVIASTVSQHVLALDGPSPRRVINASGVIIHTNLGRAPLSAEAIEAMKAVAAGNCDLEFDVATGERGSRNVHIESILCRLTGAEAALVVNNNASAVLLGLTALAKRKEVIVSRGQAVEIGGGFRVPDVMRQSGAKLVEVGTTNCTYTADYEQAVTPRTAAFLRVHSSNFRVVGFTHFVTLEEMIALTKKHSLVVLDDLGSGCFLDTAPFGLEHEPTVQESIAGGAGLVFFSGDKLVGGPQAGIIVGKKTLVDKLKKHPLARAVRVDKTRLAGLRATLVHYLKGEAVAKIPVWQMISMPLSDIEKRAKVWAKAAGAEVIDGRTMVGGGSIPGGSLPTKLVALPGGKKLSESLRSCPVPVIGRVEKDRLLLDPRTVLPDEDRLVIEALHHVEPIPSS